MDRRLLMRVAYADPPYPGRARKIYGRHPDYAGEVDHAALIARLVTEFPDGWALSTSSPCLRTLLPFCPADVRVAAWVKPYTPWKRGINPVYAWEPVIFRGGRRQRQQMNYDWLSCSPQMRSVVTGQKPEQFCYWLFGLLGLRQSDELVDLFPGSRAVSRAWDRWQRQMRLPAQLPRYRQVQAS